MDIFKNLKADFSASIIVFLVALPLCLGIALASGAPLFSGLIAGIVGGIVVASLSGSPLGVSGPAAGLAVIVLTAIQDLGAFETFLLAVVIGGVIQVILGFLKAGVIGYYFPSSVIKGMLAGIGVLIILKQIPHFFGYDADPAGDFAFNQVDGENTFSEIGKMMEFITPGALIIAVISLAILVLWETPKMKSIKAFRLIQGPLVAVVTAVVLGIFFAGGSMGLAAEQMVSIPVPDSVAGFFNQFTLPDFTQWNNPQVYTVAITLAVVASLETLLCVEATDKLDPENRITPTNLELKAQGVGNVVSGLIGGLPITQVIVRSSANIQSGGKSKLSAIIHGFFLLISVATIPFILNKIPLASLAAILIVVGYKLANPKVFKAVYAQGKGQFIPFIVTIAGIVLTDLLTGIALGMVVAIVDILWNNYKRPFHFDPKEHVPGEPIRIELSEDLSFLNKASIMRTLEEIPNNEKVTIDASHVLNVHPDILEIIDKFEESSKERNIDLEIISRKKNAKINPVRELQTIIREPAMAELN